MEKTAGPEGVLIKWFHSTLTCKYMDSRLTCEFFPPSFFSPDLMLGPEGGSAGLLRCGKGSTWEGGVRVPAIARWKSKIGRGRITAQLGSHLDLFPTIMKIADGALPNDRTLDGVDMTNLLYSRRGKVIGGREGGMSREGGREGQGGEGGREE